MPPDLREYPGKSTEGPLAQLHRRIEDAREPRLAPPRPADSEDPLESLRRRIESATDFDEEGNPPGAAGNPLLDLEATLDRARRRTERRAFESSAPASPSSAAGDPLQRLRRLLAEERREVGSRAAVDLAPRTERAAPSGAPGPEIPAREAADDVDLERRVGREVLEILEQQPLPGPARAEAIRRLAEYLDDPDPELLREVFRLLVAPRDPDSA